jgi:Family of unknown function (DUF6150)
MPRVYETSTYGEAHLRVARVRCPGEADLCVHRVGSWGFARGDTLWYLTPNKQDANLWIYYVSFGAAQLRVCFVDTYGLSGWKRAHALKGRLERLR